MNDKAKEFQAVIAGWKKERAETQMTLGKMVMALSDMPIDAKVARLYFPHSYRGYYCDLAFELAEETVSAKHLLHECIDVMHKSFQGYKGGWYVMDNDTPVWIAEYGELGQRLMAINHDGTIETADDEDY